MFGCGSLGSQHNCLMLNMFRNLSTWHHGCGFRGCIGAVGLGPPTKLPRHKEAGASGGSCDGATDRVPSCSSNFQFLDGTRFIPCHHILHEYYSRHHPSGMFTVTACGKAVSLHIFYSCGKDAANPHQKVSYGKR